MVSIRSGILSGFVATFVVSAMIVMKNATGEIPELHIAHMLSTVLGSPANVLVGWLSHFLIGTVVWGITYAFLTPYLPTRSYLGKGIAFGLLTWLAMMLVLMPLGGAGFFGINRGLVIPIATLVMNLIYGGVLGAVYAWDNAPIQQVQARKAKEPSGS